MRSQLPPLAHVSVIVGHCWSTCVELLHHSEFIKMLLLSNRIKFCSLAFTAARLYSSGPAAANKNPLVYFDIAADKEPLGRVTFEVLLVLVWMLMFQFDVLTQSLIYSPQI